MARSLIKPLQSLRGLFALMIFAHHYMWDGTSLLTAGGDCGVAFFMMLSGFVLMHGYGSRIEAGAGAWRHFVGRRLLHIYPMHIICLLLFILITPGLHIGEWLAANILLLQAWVPVSGVYFSGNAVAWCLSDFLFFYAVFPLLVLWLRRSPRGFAAFCAIYFAAYFPAAALMPEPAVLPLLYVNPIFRLGDFLLGMLLCRFLEKRSAISPGTLAEMAAVGLLAAGILLYPAIPTRWSVAAFWWPLMAFVIGVFATSHGALTRLLSLPPILWLGSVSFAYYMVHNIAIRACYLAARAAGIEPPQSIMLASSFLLALLAAWLLTRLTDSFSARLRHA